MAIINQIRQMRYQNFRNKTDKAISELAMFIRFFIQGVKKKKKYKL